MFTMSRPSRTGGAGGARASAIGTSTDGGASTGGGGGASSGCVRSSEAGISDVASTGAAGAAAGASAGARDRVVLRRALAAGGAGDSSVKGCDGGGERVRRRRAGAGAGAAGASASSGAGAGAAPGGGVTVLRRRPVGAAVSGAPRVVRPRSLLRAEECVGGAASLWVLARARRVRADTGVP